MAPDVEWIESDGAPLGGGTHRGPEAVLQGVFGAVAGGYEEFRVDVDEVLSAGDVVVVLGHLVALLRGDARPSAGLPLTPGRR